MKKYTKEQILKMNYKETIAVLPTNEEFAKSIAEANTPSAKAKANFDKMLKWGGSRPGAGRKKETPAGAKRHNLLLTDEELEKVKEFIDQLRKPSN